MFEDLIKAARENTPTPAMQVQVSASKEETAQDKPKVEENSQIRIAVLGVGGAGCNNINRLTKGGLKSATAIAINTDAKHLNMVQAHKKLLIGKNTQRGLGAGGDPNVAKRCAEGDAVMLRKEIGEQELVFIVAGMGGGTGSGAAPVIAKICKEQGAVVISIVTYPFALERMRTKKAQAAINELLKESDTVIVIDNNLLLKNYPNLALDRAFEVVDSVANRAVRGIADTIMFPSLMNIDYADVRAVMSEGGIAVISLGEAKGTNKVDEVVKDTLAHPLLDVNYENAKGALIHIECGSAFTLGDAVAIGNKITQSFDDNASVKMGARVNHDMYDSVKVMTIVTGVKCPNILSKPKEEQEQTAQYF